MAPRPRGCVLLLSLLVLAAGGAARPPGRSVRGGGPPAWSACPGCFFRGPQAAWLYAGRTPRWGAAHPLDSAAWYTPGLATGDHGFGAPVQHTDGRYGATRFSDAHYGPGWRHDRVTVPNPPRDVFTPSCGWQPPGRFGATGCYGAYDGKDFIIDDANGDFYELDQLYVDGAGHPVNFGPMAFGVGPCGRRHEPVCGVRGVFHGNLARSAPNLGGGSAAGVVSGAGDIVAGELACATCLNHAIQVVASPALVNGVTCNAFPTGKNGDGGGWLPEAVLCEGGILQYTGDWRALDPGTHAPAVLALARALAVYGGIIVDQGGPSGPGIYFYSDYGSPPDLTGAGDLLRRLVVYYGTTTLR